MAVDISGKEVGMANESEPCCPPNGTCCPPTDCCPPGEPCC